MLFGKSSKETMSVEGMSCAHFERNVEAGLREIAGVTKVKVDHRKGQVTVYYRDQAPDRETIRKKVEELGYSIKG